MIAALFAAVVLLASPASAPRVVGGSSSIFGGNVTVPAGEVRQGDLVVFGGNVTINGDVTHDLSVFGGDVELDGHVGHDVVVFGGNLHLGPHAVVGHDVALIGGNVDRDPGAQIGHEMTQGFGPRTFPSWSWFGIPGLPGFGLPPGLSLAAGMVLLALLVHLFFPAHVQLAGEVLEARPVATLGYGCLSAIAGVLLAIVLGITIIGLLGSVVIAVAMLAGWMLGWTAIFTAIGRRLAAALHWNIDPIVTLLLGGALAAVLVNVPLLGGLFGLVVGSMALGAAVLTRFGTRPAPPPPMGDVR